MASICKKYTWRIVASYLLNICESIIHTSIRTNLFLHQAIIYEKKFDNVLRTACKQGGSAEAVFEGESVSAEMQKIQDCLVAEEAERKAARGIVDDEESGSGGEEAAETVASLRKPPTAYAQGSKAYWRAVANQIVRTYITVAVEGKSLDGIASAVQNSPLRDMRGTLGESSIIIHMDVDLLGETYGPNCQENLRKRFQPEVGLLRKLLHGCLLGRGAQRRTEEGEATAVPEGDLVLLHTGIDRSTSTCLSLFRLATAKKEDMDSEVKNLLVTFDDDSIRDRQKRVKGAYSTYSTFLLASSQALSQAIPERQFQFHKGYCMSDCFGPVRATPVSELWHATRTHQQSYYCSCIF